MPSSSIDSSLDTAGLGAEQRGLLDFIDKLQFCQLDNVKLPQIVVVGDQSAGKSSVLEALTGTPFPRDAGACTRFATEIRLRRDREYKLAVSIIPDKNRPYDEQIRLKAFGGNVHGDTSFDALMRDAVEVIVPKHVTGRFAARDILVVEKSGPDMPLLTLVDLPGLVRVSNRDQSEADIQTIEALSDRYMRPSRTIILAVIGGNNDYVQAPILKKARKFDPSGSRTIGVLTKPDLTEQIGLEDKFIELVSSKDEENNFKLGWYVLLNPAPPRAGETWPGAEQRRAREEGFFGRGKWSTLPPSMCGVGALRQRLSLQLQRHIGRHVKSLRRQIQKALEDCEGELKAMGTARDNVEEMRQDMGELFSASNHLVIPAVDGTYKNPPGERFFAKQSDPRGTPSQKLRARVRAESERFSRRFRHDGRKMNFFSSSSSFSTFSNLLPEAGSASLAAKREFAQREVEPLLMQIRGNELPLDSNPRAPYILFQDYSANWPTLAQEYKDNLGVICNEFLANVIDYVWPLRMREPLRHYFLEPRMKEMMGRAEEELSKLRDDMELEIQPFDPEYENHLRQWRFEAGESGGTYTEAEEVLEKMLIYYELTARIFIRNVVTQVVERHLLLGMLGLFNPVKILGMANDVVESISSESRETRDRRLALKAQWATVKEAKEICTNLAMRSELRAYDDVEDEESQSEDDTTATSASSRNDAYHNYGSHDHEPQSGQRPILPPPPMPSQRSDLQAQTRSPRSAPSVPKQSRMSPEDAPPEPAPPPLQGPPHERQPSNASRAAPLPPPLPAAIPTAPQNPASYSSSPGSSLGKYAPQTQQHWEQENPPHGEDFIFEGDSRPTRQQQPQPQPTEGFHSGTQPACSMHEFQAAAVQQQQQQQRDRHEEEKKERRYRLPRLS